MARKDLSRTVIEGGRYHRNAFMRGDSHGIERARTRAWLDRVRVDTDEAEDTVPVPRPRIGKEFYDKLSPARRWLAAQIGRPWVVVYSELTEKFDTRTVAGRHVVHDHMLAWVRTTDIVSPYYLIKTEFVVDAHGILRADPWSRRALKRLRAETDVWRANRFAQATPRGWWWFRIDPKSVCSDFRCARDHVWRYGEKLHEVRFLPVGPMTAGERRRVDRLPPPLRLDIVIV